MRVKAKEKTEDYRLSWHTWFAWYPIKIKDVWIWLEVVQRKGVYYSTPGDYWWLFEFKLIKKE